MKVRGFTLVEMVLTMVVGSILILGIAGFVELGSKGYSDTVARQRIQTQAKFVLEKMTREIRHAVPNSFAAEDDCLSFYPIVYSGFYSIDETDNKTLSYIVGNSSFNVGDDLKMIINPTNVDEFEGDNTIDFSASPISLSSPLASQSIANRFYVYKEKVEYCVDTSSQSISRNSILVADSVSFGEFAYDAPTQQRGGVVHLSLIFKQNGEESEFETDVQVLNVP
ncbi:PilW family protein [Vibrio ziniensis]|uniref:Prepilin-type N-terminal cleavage/methylation domain-containing protein n=1 Tax=Vibrio ziniensis TaxID=2711221 RepID=A0A6G7CLA8_9VIBR|nr:prepilin-type N-terminal cleavage/methylation domain-containing protein [Vibrio ziniensis]QIH42828.1 prepilin-type N-terminal cleavage/methylation domain-containing protein [Vibrio ziniensis]